MGRQILYVVVELFRGNISLKQLEGPLGIARESGRAARQGISELLSLMAMIGVNLAVLNLLPIPPLDGGHILLLIIEGAMQHDLSVRFKERFVTVSMVFLLLVFAIVMYNDVLRLIPHTSWILNARGRHMSYARGHDLRVADFRTDLCMAPHIESPQESASMHTTAQAACKPLWKSAACA